MSGDMAVPSALLNSPAQHDHFETERARHLVREHLQGGALRLSMLFFCPVNPLWGVRVAKSDSDPPKHKELDVSSLEFTKALQSLTSRGHPKTRCCWQWYYYVLAPEGVEHLGEWCVFSLQTCDLLPPIAPGSTSPPICCPPHIETPRLPLVPPQSAPGERKFSVLPVATVTTTVRRRLVPLITSGPNLVLEVADLGIKGHGDGSSYDEKLPVSMAMHLERMPPSFFQLCFNLYFSSPSRSTYVDNKKKEDGVRRPSDEASGYHFHYLFDDLTHARILDG